MKKQMAVGLVAVLMMVAVEGTAGDQGSAFKAGEGVLLAQASAPSLACSVTPAGAFNTFSQGYCVAPYAASGYTVVFKVSGGSGNQSYAWNVPAGSNCTSTTAACTFTTTARRRDVEGTATVTITDLGTGAVSTLSTDYHVPITCGSYYFC